MPIPSFESEPRTDRDATAVFAAAAAAAAAGDRLGHQHAAETSNDDSKDDNSTGVGRHQSHDQLRSDAGPRRQLAHSKGDEKVEEVEGRRGEEACYTATSGSSGRRGRPARLPV